MLLAVTGLRREARMVEAPGIVTVSGGGDRTGLERQIAAALDGSIRGIVSIGVAGALAPGWVPGDCLLASHIVDGPETFVCNPAWRDAVSQKIPGIRIAPISGSDSILVNAEQKAVLLRTSGAAAVDMESHIAARAAQAHGLPFLALRTISDSSVRVLPPAALAAMKPDGGIAVGAVARSLVARPAQIPALIVTARESERAFASLFRCLGLLGPGLAFADFG